MSALLTQPFVQVDAESLPDISESFDVEAVPTFIVLQGHTLLGRISGADASALTDTITKHIRAPSSVTPQSHTEKAPAAPTVVDQGAESDEELNKRLHALMQKDKVMLFMKGNPEQPRCGFSRRIVALLQDQGVQFSTFDILEDESVSMEFSLEPSHLLARLDKVALSTDRGNGRTLEELFRSKDPLKGEEAQRLRTFCTSNSVIPARDLDQYGLALMIGDLMSVKSDFSGRVARLASATRSVEEARAAAAKELFALKWGPTRTPIYDLLIVGTVLVPSKRENQLKVAHWLVHDAKVPVNGRDLSGSTAMNHAISTKPVFDPDFAEILYEGGGDVNDRN
ncbi:hypothetical protein EW026_g1051 [Hermanssonia centrifuga]|uniref:Glutaredoxin domain-containing protein n=1 Tax=Hermanssonia centrifuga TaxID=98765 RepID=A0A4S4KSW7_9APHY|nr:hypothetical protein EW026_g1051 [Hermanssonia centrifuga]